MMTNINRVGRSTTLTPNTYNANVTSFPAVGRNTSPGADMSNDVRELVSTLSWLHGYHYGGCDTVEKARQRLGRYRVDGLFVVFTDESPENSHELKHYTLMYTSKGAVVALEVMQNDAGGMLEVSGTGYSAPQIEQIVHHVLDTSIHTSWLACGLSAWLDRVSYVSLAI